MAAPLVALVTVWLVVAVNAVVESTGMGTGNTGEADGAADDLVAVSSSAADGGATSGKLVGSAWVDEMVMAGDALAEVLGTYIK